MLARLRKSVSLAPAADSPAPSASPVVASAAASTPPGSPPPDKRAALRAAVAPPAAALDAETHNFLCDRTLDRFLTARDGDVARAAKQLEATLRWRASFPVAPLAAPAAGSRSDSSATGAALRAQASSGKMAVLPTADGRGRSTILMRTGLENSSDDRAKMQYLVYTLERASNVADAAGGGQYIVLNDYTVGSASLSNLPSLPVMRDTTAILQGHYPERLACMVFIGAPRVFHALFRVIRPLVDPATRDKLHFVDRPELVASIGALDRCALPRCYGGDVDWEFDVARYFDEDAQMIRAL